MSITVIDMSECLTCCGSSSSTTTTGTTTEGSSTTTGECVPSCPDEETLTLDFGGEIVSLTGGPGTWSGTGTPGGCVSDWTFTVTCSSNNVWNLSIVKGADANNCLLSGNYLGTVTICDPLEVEFNVAITSNPTPCCIGGMFPRAITAVVTL